MSAQPVPPSNQFGASLIEVLVAVVIFSIGLLGMAAMQTRALKANLSSLHRSQVVMLSHYILDVMRVDRNAASGGDYNTGTQPACSRGAFTGSTLAQHTLADWLTIVKAHIGTATDASTCVRVQCSADQLCTVQIQWDDRASGGLGQQTLAVDSRI